MNTSRRGLGRGLDALLQSTETPVAIDAPEIAPATTEPDAQSADPAAAPDSGPRLLPVSAIQPNPYQPRHVFDEVALSELTASIQAHGLIQPLLVTPDGQGFRLIAGERRWQAAQRAGLEQVPVVVREATPQQMLALAIIENVQRADLDPIEAATGYRRLMDEFDMTQTQVARLVGKSRVALANTVRLLGLGEDLQRLVSAGHLSEGHARALLPIADLDEQRRLAREAIAGGWTVRRIEAAVRAITQPGRKATPAVAAGSGAGSAAAELDPDTRAAVDALEAKLGTRVEIRRRGAGGQLVLHFYSEEELSALYDRLVARPR
ncbi:MAG: ParB/RepB/Spo0J family partition protein [Chloroflexi bacterium]|nr:ParB/RepB/Spo0J family partition protein [Chloroflexota bacterium]